MLSESMTEAGWRMMWMKAACRLGLAAITVAASGATAQAADKPEGVAVTLSGVPAAPFNERTLKVGVGGLGIRFRAPSNRILKTLHTLWRRSDGTCSATLHMD